MQSILPITGWWRHSRGAGRGAGDRKPLAAVPGGSWLPHEGLHFLPTPLEVQISFGDNLGVICSTSSKLLNQILIWPQTPMNCPCRFGEAGAQMGQSPFWEPGRQTGFLGVSWGGEHAEEALVQSPHNFFPEGWGWGDTRCTNPASIPPIWGLGSCRDLVD